MPELTQEEKKLLEFSTRTISRLRQAKQEVSKNDEKYYKYFVGKHWKTDNPDHPRPVTNFCFSHIRTSVALISDNRPIITAYPVDKTDINKANLISRVIVNVWDKNNCNELYSKVLYDSHIFGTGFWKVIWDDSISDVGIFLVPPEYCYVDKSATDIHSCKTFAQIQPVSIADAKDIYEGARWAENLDKLNGVSDEGWVLDRKEIADNSTSDKGTIKFSDTTGKTVTEYPADEFFKMSHDSETTTIIEELWYWDYSTKTFWVLTTAEGMLIDLKEKGERLPFVPFYNYWDGNRFWGESEIKHIAPLNRDYNITKAAILDHIRLSGNTLIITDTNSNIDVEYLTNLEALVVTKTPGSEFRRDAPPPMSQEAFKVLGDLKFEIDTTTGIHDVMQGRRPAGMTAGIAIAELQEAAQVPIRDKARRVQSALNLAGKLIFDLLKKHYKKSRWVRIIKDTKPEMYEVKPEDIQKEFDIYFDIESQFGQTRGQKLEMMIKLFGMQLADKQAVHDTLGLPDRADILRRMATSRAMDALIASGQLGQIQSPNQDDINQIAPQMGNGIEEEVLAGGGGQ